MKYDALIQQQAKLVFGNKAKADHWLSQPIAGAAKGSRLQVAQDETGYELVKAELERLNHGFAC